MAIEGAALLPGKETDAPGEPEYAPVAALPVLPGRRLASIDALRGFDMFWLMQEESGLVLALAAALHLPFQAVLAKQLDHTPWVGITFWDLIAPLFLFIVGLSLPFAIQSRLRRGESRKTILYHILRRTALLIVLGLVFNGILQLNFSDFRYTGVLQRIALSYVFAAIITLMTKLRGQIAWTVALLVGYWAIMALIPVPGFGRNVLTEQGNLEGYIDRLFLPGKFCCYVFVVPENVAAEFARQKQTVDIPLEIALLGKHVAAEAGNRDERHDGPIPHQQGHRPCNLAAQLGHQRDDGGKNVREGNALQHAGVTEVREVELQDPVEDQAQNDQQRGAAQDVVEDGLAALTAAQTALNSERQT